MDDRLNKLQINVKFVTQIQNPKLRGAHGVEISIPSKLGPKALRKLLYTLLGLQESGDDLNDDDDDDDDDDNLDNNKGRQNMWGKGTKAGLPLFDFTAAGKLIRASSLANFCIKNKISLENTLDIEYILPHPVPEPDILIQTPFWITAMHRNPHSDMMVVGNCNGFCTVYDVMTMTEIVSTENTAMDQIVSGSPVNGVSWISKTKWIAIHQNCIIVIYQLLEYQSKYQAQTYKTFILQHTEAESSSNKTKSANDLEESASLSQNDTLQCIFYDDSSQNAYIGTFLGALVTIQVTDDVLNKCSLPQNSSKKKSSRKNSKRSKTEDDQIDENNSNTAPLVMHPIHVRKSHSQRITSIGAFKDQQNCIITASWDGTVQIWNPDQEEESRTIPSGGKAITNMAISSINHLIGITSTDGRVRVIDPRSGATQSSVKTTFRPPHQGIATCIRWDPLEESLLLTSSLDGEICMWDMKSVNKPVWKMTEVLGTESRITCMQWTVGKDSYSHFYVGGSNGHLKLFRVRHDKTSLEALHAHPK